MFIRAPIPNAIGHHGTVKYSYYPGGVECEIEYCNDQEWVTVKGWAQANKNKVDCYDRKEYAKRAYIRAIEQIPPDERRD